MTAFCIAFLAMQRGPGAAGVYVPGLTEIQVTNMTELLQVSTEISTDRENR